MIDAPCFVSVVMPAFNSRAYIGEAIRSVLDQDYEALELIVVDDGSTDGTPDVARGFGDTVRVIEQSNSGPAAARNRGVSVARGDLIAFIDSDDVWLPGKISAQIDYLNKHPDVGVVFGRFIRWLESPEGKFGPPPSVDELPTARLVTPSSSGWIYPEMLLDSVIWIVSAMVRRSVWEHLGGLNEQLRCGEDYDFFLRASRVCRIIELDQVVAYYRIHRQSTTQIVRSDDFECQVLLNAIQRFGTAGPDGRSVCLTALRKRLFRLYFTHGYRHFQNGKPDIAAKAFLHAMMRGRCLSPKALVYFLLSSLRRLKSVRNS